MSLTILFLEINNTLRVNKKSSFINEEFMFILKKSCWVNLLVSIIKIFYLG